MNGKKLLNKLKLDYVYRFVCNWWQNKKELWEDFQFNYMRGLINYWWKKNKWVGHSIYLLAVITIGVSTIVLWEVPDFFNRISSLVFFVISIWVALLCVSLTLIIVFFALSMISVETLKDYYLSSPLARSYSEKIKSLDPAFLDHIHSIQDEGKNQLCKLPTYVAFMAFFYYGLSLLLILFLLTTLAGIASCYFGNGVAFNNLCHTDGPISHFYYIIVTFVTVGYGDITPNGNWFSRAFIIFICFQSLSYIVLAGALIISHVSKADETINKLLECPII